MPRVVWRDRAKRHLQEITRFIKQHNPQAAITYAEGIRAACQKLSQFPDRGRHHDESFRLIVYRNHLIFYRYDSNTDKVVISAVLDGRRDIAQIVPDLLDD